MKRKIMLYICILSMFIVGCGKDEAEVKNNSNDELKDQMAVTDTTVNDLNENTDMNDIVIDASNVGLTEQEVRAVLKDSRLLNCFIDNMEYTFTIDKAIILNQYMKDKNHIVDVELILSNNDYQIEGKYELTLSESGTGYELLTWKTNNENTIPLLAVPENIISSAFSSTIFETNYSYELVDTNFDDDNYIYEYTYDIRAESGAIKINETRGYTFVFDTSARKWSYTCEILEDKNTYSTGLTKLHMNYMLGGNTTGWIGQSGIYYLVKDGEVVKSVDYQPISQFNKGVSLVARYGVPYGVVDEDGNYVFNLDTLGVDGFYLYNCQDYPQDMYVDDKAVNDGLFIVYKCEEAFDGIRNYAGVLDANGNWILELSQDNLFASEISNKKMQDDIIYCGEGMFIINSYPDILFNIYTGEKKEFTYNALEYVHYEMPNFRFVNGVATVCEAYSHMAIICHFDANAKRTKILEIDDTRKTYFTDTCEGDNGLIKVDDVGYFTTDGKQIISLESYADVSDFTDFTDGYAVGMIYNDNNTQYLAAYDSTGNFMFEPVEFSHTFHDLYIDANNKYIVFVKEINSFGKQHGEVYVYDLNSGTYLSSVTIPYSCYGRISYSNGVIMYETRDYYTNALYDKTYMDIYGNTSEEYLYY